MDLHAIASLPAAELVPPIFMALAVCFLGYPMFRVATALNGLGLGIVLAAWAMERVLPAPAGWHYLAACLSGGMLATYLGWRLWRGVLAVQMGLATWLAIALAMSMPLTAMASLIGWTGGPGARAAGLGISAAAWAVSLSAGVAATLVTFLLARRLVTFLTALAGAFGAVLLASLMVIDTPERLWEMLNEPMRHVNTLGIWCGAALLLLIAGMLTQSRLAGRFRIAFPKKTKPAPQAVAEDARERKPARPGRGQKSRKAVSTVSPA